MDIPRIFNIPKGLSWLLPVGDLGGGSHRASSKLTKPRGGRTVSAPTTPHQALSHPHPRNPAPPAREAKNRSRGTTPSSA